MSVSPLGLHIMYKWGHIAYYSLKSLNKTVLKLVKGCEHVLNELKASGKGNVEVEKQLERVF